MAKFALSNGAGNGTQQALTTTYKTLVALTAATGATTLRKAWIYDVMFGADGTPADNAMRYVINRQTTLGTGTAAVPAPLDVDDAAALIVGTTNHTAEPTVTASTQLMEVAVNQRASYRWVAAPGSELIVPATNVAGLGLRANSPAYTGTALGAIQFFE